MRRFIDRRRLIAGLAALGALPFAGSAARAQSLDGTSLGIASNSTDDQSGPLQDALFKAAAEGRPLFLPAGTYMAGNLQIPSNLVLQGVPGGTVLAASGPGPVARISGSRDVRLEGLSFGAGAAGPNGADRGLLEIEASGKISLADCTFQGGDANGLAIRDAGASIDDCAFSGHALAALFAIDSRGLAIESNRITNCGNGGILIWGSANRHDGSIVAGNAISGIGWTNGGNGQNGNGINVFRSDDVVVSGNQIADCAFTAIRLNATNNVAVTSNVCRNSGEVAIFSEFGFSGSVIADNLVDGAAAGISITNLDQGGRLAVCSGNIVRNIRSKSEVNPDTRPVGIYAEAETAISGNSIDSVPGIGILAGNGPFLRNVAITGNMLSDATIGIAVSTVAEAGAVEISGNLIAGAEHALVGMEWDRMVSDDLVRDAARYPHISLGGNRAG